MSLLKTIFWIWKKDATLEWRQKYALSALLLYVLATSFVVYGVFQRIDSLVWISLYWIIVLFASMNAVAKSFIEEKENTRIYFYLLASPQAYVLAKMVYNVMLMNLLSTFTNFIFSVLWGFPLSGLPLWSVVTILGSSGFAIAFTMISAIAAKGRSPGMLMTILGLPIIIPQILVLVKVSKQAIAGMSIESAFSNLLTLGAIDCILVAVAIVFFPFLWRE